MAYSGPGVIFSSLSSQLLVHKGPEELGCLFIKTFCHNRFYFHKIINRLTGEFLKILRVALVPYCIELL